MLILTCFVGCRLQITSFPPFFLASNGRVPAGTICSVVPRQRERSAFLEKKKDRDDNLVQLGESFQCIADAEIR